MGINLKPFLREDASYLADDIVTNLVESITGRGIGDHFVADVKRVASNSFVLELDDGCQFKMTCKKIS